jgi:hypothetical protein
MAYALLHTFQKEMLRGTEFVNTTFKTIQNKIIKTTAWVREMKTIVRIELPRCCPTKTIQSNWLEMFSIMRVWCELICWITGACIRTTPVVQENHFHKSQKRLIVAQNPTRIKGRNLHRMRFLLQIAV